MDPLFQNSETSSNSGQKNISISEKFSIRDFFSYIGPGLLISIAYLDPGNLAGDMLAGQDAKYHLLWLLMVATIAGYFFQTLSINLGVITNEDLATLCRQYFPKKTSFLLWLMAEIAIIGADIQEVLGSAIALQILFSIPLWGGVLITIADTFIILLIHHYGIKKLEIVFAFLLLIMFLCFLVNLILIKPIVGDLFEGIFVPTIPSGSLNAASGLVGCIIMPHNLFLHSSLVKTKKFDNQDQLKTGLRYMKGELALSLVFSFIINATVISTFAYFANFDEEISLSNAGDYLSRTFGSGGKYVWAIGLLASGQSATVTGTLAGQFIMTGFLNLNISPFRRSVITRSFALVPSILVVFLNDPTTMNENLNILQAIQLPFAIVPLLKFSYSKKVMGNHSMEKRSLIIYSFICFLLIAFNIFSELYFSDISGYRIYLYVIGIIIYLIVIIFVIIQPVEKPVQTEITSTIFEKENA